MHEFDPLRYKIIGLSMDAHRFLGAGFPEKIYQEALAYELTEAGLEFEREKEIPILYRNGIKLGIGKPDFIVAGIIVELKAQACLSNADRAQLLNYLKCSPYQIGLLINFGSSSLEYKRFASPPKSVQSSNRCNR